MSKKRGGEDASSREAISSKKMLGELTHKKISYYLTKTYLSDADFYQVFKEFFKELLDIKYEFTCKELLEELDKVYLDELTRNRLTKLVNQVNTIEYKENAYKEEDIKNMFTELKELVSILIRNSEPKKEGGLSGWFKKVFGKKQETNEGFMLKRKPVEENKNTEEEQVPEIQIDDDEKPKKEEPKKQEIKEEPKIEKPIEKEEIPETIELSTPVPEIDFAEPSVANKEISYESSDWHEDVEPVLVEKKKPTEKKKKTKKVEKSKPSKKKEKPKAKSTPDIKKLIAEANKLKSKTSLKKKYDEILKEYNTLTVKEQHKYYPSVNKIYERIS